MSSMRPKLARLRLDPIAYESLRQQVLRRDGWRCQLCGAMSNLEVHHKQFRSHSGDDSEENLVNALHSMSFCPASLVRAPKVSSFHIAGPSKCSIAIVGIKTQNTNKAEMKAPRSGRSNTGDFLRCRLAMRWIDPDG